MPITAVMENVFPTRPYFIAVCIRNYLICYTGHKGKIKRFLNIDLHVYVNLKPLSSFPVYMKVGQFHRNCNRRQERRVFVAGKALFIASLKQNMYISQTETSLIEILSGPVSCLLLGVSSDYAQPITGQVTEVTFPVIGRAHPEPIPNKRQKTDPGVDHTHPLQNITTLALQRPGRSIMYWTDNLIFTT